NHADADGTDDRPYSSKNLMECYRRAEAHWNRREEVRARSEGPWKRGVGLASQIWYGGGGPPSYAWVRIGSDGRATVITAMQDIGTGTRTAMAQIAAEESPSETRTRSRRSPSSSAAICAIAVRVPVPMCCIAVITVARPSEPIRTHAYDGGPPPPYQI